ncbi:uncharacterized protein F4812DRAFT_421880 [Daldinia caldariorum]|uniref:uncharacterized protein n=1 Tax=Daldinia caldariorum TaxID=326644 RepID=UPI002007BFAE|nr:uncharacterized protein F4812DRAFT_421880 [Daldinia caldariorum]KAI1470206.1 hypothetical protein F4812DRAFT_421880 [Daldinia caldariorum]
MVCTGETGVFLCFFSLLLRWEYERKKPNQTNPLSPFDRPAVRMYMRKAFFVIVIVIVRVSLSFSFLPAATRTAAAEVAIQPGGARCSRCSLSPYKRQPGENIHTPVYAPRKWITYYSTIAPTGKIERSGRACPPYIESPLPDLLSDILISECICAVYARARARTYVVYPNSITYLVGLAANNHRPIVKLGYLSQFQSRGRGRKRDPFTLAS